MDFAATLEPERKMGNNRCVNPLRLAGLILWRSGLLLVGAYSFFRVARLALRFVELPRELEVGVGLVLAGAALVVVSLIWERVQDSKTEGDLLA